MKKAWIALNLLCLGGLLVACSDDDSEGDPGEQIVAGAAGEAGTGGQPSAGAGGQPSAGAGGQNPGSGAGGQATGSDSDLGFRASSNGFGFENYSNDAVPSNLTASELQVLFGAQVCASGSGAECVLTPVARGWMDRLNESMNGGHCEGMAALSLLFFKGQRSAQDFGASSVPDLQLSGNAKLAGEIARWFATQASRPTASSEFGKDKSPAEVVARLRELWASGETATMGIYKPGYNDGHAITPYAVVDKGGGVVDVMVYDNNFPREERALIVDLNANTWQYVASTNPSEPAALYQGDAQTGTLTITPTQSRLSMQDCDFCRGEGEQAPGAQFNEIILTGGGDLLITDDTGKRLGYDAGKFYREISGANFVPIKSADLFLDDPEPYYVVPTNLGFTVTLDGSQLGAMSQNAVSMSGPGYFLEVDGITLDPGQKDQLTFSKDGNEIQYQTQSDETPAVELSFETAAADYFFEVTGSSAGGGIRVKLSHDVAQKKLAIRLEGAKSYDLVMGRFDDAGEQVFSHAGEASSDTAVIYIPYGMWPGNGQSLGIEVDSDGDGTIDETNQLTDEN